MAAVAPRKGFIGILPRVIQPFSLRTAYGLRLGGWSPFGLMPSMEESAWPKDLWQGDEARGKHIANRRFTLAGCDISFSRHIGWFSKEGSLQWLRALHSFAWMRDVVAFNDSKAGVKLLRGFVDDWLNASDRLPPIAREADVMGERLANWVLHGRLLLNNAQPAFRRRVLHSVVRQALMLRQMIRAEDGVIGLSAAKGLLLVSLALPQCGILYRDGMRELHRQLEELKDMQRQPRGRNPMYMHKTLRSLIDIQSALRQKLGAEEAELNETVLELAQMLAYVLHGDGGFALFNGATEGTPEEIAQTLAFVQNTLDAESPAVRAARQATATSLMERTGYARLQAGNTVLLVDTAPADPTQADSYYGTSAFEMSHGGLRYVVNCGSFIGNDPAWSRVVKTTAAHSTVCVDDRNSCQFHAGVTPQLQLEGSKAQPDVERRLVERDGYQFFEVAYNGYVPYSGLMHSRQLLINEDGTRLSGADHLTLVEGYENGRSHDVNLRFHLHPAIQAKRLMNGMVVLAPTDGSEEWTFHSSVGQAVELEESIYLGIDGKPQSTTQIIIYAPFDPQAKWVVEWSFIKS